MGLTAAITELREKYEKFRMTREFILALMAHGVIENGNLMPLSAIQAIAGHLGSNRLDDSQVEKMARGLRFLQEQQLLGDVSVIPVTHVVDLLVAAPVWFVEAPNGTIDGQDWDNHDPQPDSAVRFFCDLVPTQRFANLYQLYNRRTRAFKRYEGDTIPTRLATLIAAAKPNFDYLVIATPYHDVAGREWEDPDWLANIDPFLVGFQEGLPFMFFLGRWSDTGLFPLVTEMVADTMNHLKENKAKLANFGNAYWYSRGIPGACAHNCHVGQDPRGELHSLEHFANEVLAAYEAGQLFDYLRGQWTAPTTTNTNVATT
jgi:hypothetical protein